MIKFDTRCVTSGTKTPFHSKVYYKRDSLTWGCMMETGSGSSPKPDDLGDEYCMRVRGEGKERRPDRVNFTHL